MCAFSQSESGKYVECIIINNNNIIIKKKLIIIIIIIIIIIDNNPHPYLEVFSDNEPIIQMEHNRHNMVKNPN